MTSFGLRSGYRKKGSMRKQGYISEGHYIDINNLRTKYNLHVLA